MEDNENINQHLKNTLNDYLVQPKITSFDEVIKKLEKKRKRRFIFVLFSGVFLLTLGTGLFFNLENTSEKLVQNSASLKNKTKGIELNDTKSNIKPDKITTTENSSPSSKSTTTKISKPETIRSDIKPRPKNQEKGLNKKRKTSIASPPQAAELPVSPSTKDVSTLEETQKAASNTDDLVIADVLNSKKSLLPSFTNNVDLPSNELLFQEIVTPTSKDSTKKEKKTQFLWGISYNPQMGTYHFSKNNGGSLDNEFSKAYLENKKAQNSLKFNFSLGLKAGMLIKDKWELLAGLSYQRYRQEETIKQLIDGGPAPTVTIHNTSNGFYYSTNFEKSALQDAIFGNTYTSTYKYLDYSLELNRIFKFNSSLKLKAGMGFHAQQLFLRKSSSVIIATAPDIYYYRTGPNSSTSTFLYSIDVKGGIIEDLTKKLQLQFCPNFFYSPKSMFKKDYVIKQKNYGFGVEVLFLFKIG